VLYEDSVSEDVGIIEAHVVVLPNELLGAGGRRCRWVIEGNDEYRLRTHTTHTHTHQPHGTHKKDVIMWCDNFPKISCIHRNPSIV
jgi:hypothetical protein